MKKAAAMEARRQAVVNHEAIRRNLSFWLSEKMDSVKAMAGLSELRNALLKKDEASVARANALLDHFQDAYRADVCYLINRAGNTVASSNRGAPDSFAGKNYAFRPYFKHAVAGAPASHHSYLALGVTSGKRGIYYRYPVYAPGGRKPIGVVAIKASIDPMERAFAWAHNAIVALIAPSGVIFMSNSKKLILRTFAKLSPQEIEYIKKDRQFGEGPWDWSGIRVVDEGQASYGTGRKYLFFKQEIDHYPGWSLVFLSDADVIFSRVSRPMIQIAGGLILMRKSALRGWTAPCFSPR